jgi:hypothetical protein
MPRSAQELQNPIHFEYVLEYINERPFNYALEVSDHIKRKTRITYSTRIIHAVFKEHGITRKYLDLIALERSEPIRRLYKRLMKKFSREQLIFVDKTHVQAKDFRRRYGYGYRRLTAITAARNI